MVGTDLESGDLILFSGVTPLHKRIQSFSGCPWSQVGMLLRWHPLNEFVVFESTKISVCNDVESGKILCGVQLTPLIERVERFQGSIAVRKVIPGLSPQQIEVLMNFYKEVKGKQYNDSKFYVVRAKHRRNKVSDFSKFYCSELVAEAYQRIGVLAKPPEGLTSNNYIPSDFASGAAFLKLTEGFELSPEFALTPTDATRGTES